MSGKDSSSDSEEKEELGAPSSDSPRGREGGAMGGVRPKRNVRAPSIVETESPSKRSKTSGSGSSQGMVPGVQVRYNVPPGRSSKAISSGAQLKTISPAKKIIGAVKKVFKPTQPDALTDLEKQAKRIAKLRAGRATWDEIYGDPSEDDINDPQPPPPPSPPISEPSTDVTSLYSSMDIAAAVAEQGTSGDAEQGTSGDAEQGTSGDAEQGTSGDAACQ